MDYDDLEEKAKCSNNKVLILCSPHNPVGRVWREDELKRL
ncbi:aminotransferase class I and II family protein [Clostridioides difficile DA00165]|nr:aminotransferase class I and II family protein [Clostridioides difficile DA00165]